MGAFDPILIYDKGAYIGEPVNRDPNMIIVNRQRPTRAVSRALVGGAWLMDQTKSPEKRPSAARPTSSWEAKASSMMVNG